MTDLTSRQPARRLLGNVVALHQRGKDCVLARQARESQLNPFNQSMQATPRLVARC